MNSQNKPAQPWVDHGALKVSDDGRFLEHADGASFFWLADTVWSLVELTPPRIADYCADRARRGFTVIHINATNFGRPNYAGDFPFNGDGPPWSTAELNEVYWKHVDLIISQAAQQGLYVMLLALWGHHLHYPKPTFWKQEIGHYIGEFFEDAAAQNERFGVLLGERYRNAPNVIWCAAGEYHGPFQRVPMTADHRNRLTAFAQAIRAGDGGQHLLSIHPMAYKGSSDDFHATVWLDFNMVQSHARADYIDHLLTGDWQRTPSKPTLLVEGSYEQNEPNPGWRQRYQAYWALTHGSLGYGYGHESLWRFVDEDGHTGVLSPAILDSPGAAAMTSLVRLLSQLPSSHYLPASDLIPLNWRSSDAGSPLGIVPGLVCAARGVGDDWVLVYSTCGYGFELDLETLARGFADAFWYNPRTGMWCNEAAESVEKRPFVTGIRCGPGVGRAFFAPSGIPAVDNDWIFLLEIRR